MRINDLRNVGLAALAILSVPPLIGCEANVPGALDHTPEQGKSEENLSEIKIEKLGGGVFYLLPSHRSISREN
jgi:hypothetical protein